MQKKHQPKWPPRPVNHMTDIVVPHECTKSLKWFDSALFGPWTKFDLPDFQVGAQIWSNAIVPIYGLGIKIMQTHQFFMEIGFLLNTDTYTDHRYYVESILRIRHPRSSTHMYLDGFVNIWQLSWTVTDDKLCTTVYLLIFMYHLRTYLIASCPFYSIVRQHF